MQINNISPAPPKTLTDLSVGDCFTLARSPGKVFILVSKFTENVELYGIVELGSDGVSVYTPSPINPFSLQDVVSLVEIHSIDFSEKK